MEESISRVLIETVVRKAIRDMKESPERSARNLVDMALSFSKGRFQQTFFTAAQNMLQNSHSPYYALIADIARNVDSERLLRFGMALGYDSCTLGADKIRSLEEERGYNIPWMLSLELDPERDYADIISQGKELGISSWMLYCPDGQQGYDLARRFPEQAFGLFCYDMDQWDSLLDQPCPENLMLAFPCREEAQGICRRAREQGLLYSVMKIYGWWELPSVEDGTVFSLAERLGGVFTMLTSVPGLPEELSARAHEVLVKARTEQQYQTIPWETVYDCGMVDSIISQGQCSAGFDREGRLLSMYETVSPESISLFKMPLSEIFRRAFPK